MPSPGAMLNPRVTTTHRGSRRPPPRPTHRLHRRRVKHRREGPGAPGAKMFVGPRVKKEKRSIHLVPVHDNASDRESSLGTWPPLSLMPCSGDGHVVPTHCRFPPLGGRPALLSLQDMHRGRPTSSLSPFARSGSLALRTRSHPASPPESLPSASTSHLRRQPRRTDSLPPCPRFERKTHRRLHRPSC